MGKAPTPEEAGKKRACIFEFAGMMMVRLQIFAALVVFTIANTAPSCAQAPQTTTVPISSFEVVSIKPDRSGEAHGIFQFRQGRFTATCIPASALIDYAYQVRDFQVSGGPIWLRSQRFDIEAKEPDEIAELLQKLPPDQRFEKTRALAQSLLADRFKMKAREETRNLPIYNLVVAKNGPKLKAAKPGVGFRWHNDWFRVERDHLTAQGVDMGTLVRVLSMLVVRAVVDQTGLAGNYELDLRWTPDFSQPDLSYAPSAPSTTNTRSDPASSGPSIFTALEEQLGLKLESTKGPAKVIVIEHIERPSEN